MIKKYGARLVVMALALVVTLGLAGVALAVSSSESAKAQKSIKVVRENSATASATATSTVYVDIPNATTTVNVPDVGLGSLLVARFQGHFSVIKTSGCEVRILVGSSQMEPAGNFPIAGQATITESVYTSGAIERSLAVGPGSYTVKAQIRMRTANSVESQCQLSGWHFAVERHQR